MVASHAAVFAGEPESTALTEDDVSRDDEFGAAAFGAKAFAGTLGGTVCSALRGVGSVAEEGNGEVEG